GAAGPVLLRRQGQGRARPGPRQEDPRQAAGPRPPRRPARDRPSRGPASQGHGGTLARRDPLSQPPAGDADVPAWLAALGVPGIVDIHVHFMPERLLARVWDYFDRAEQLHGTRWPIHYRLPEQQRLAVLRDLGVRTFAPLVYPHKPGMAASL